MAFSVWLCAYSPLFLHIPIKVHPHAVETVIFLPKWTLLHRLLYYIHCLIYFSITNIHRVLSMCQELLRLRYKDEWSYDPSFQDIHNYFYRCINKTTHNVHLPPRSSLVTIVIVLLFLFLFFPFCHWVKFVEKALGVKMWWGGYGGGKV